MAVKYDKYGRVFSGTVKAPTVEGHPYVDIREITDLCEHIIKRQFPKGWTEEEKKKHKESLGVLTREVDASVARRYCYPCPHWRDLPEPDPNLTISVLMTNHRRSPFIPYVLKRIYEQNFPKDRYEVILIDDNSRDDCWEIMERSLKNFPDLNVRCFETHKNVTWNWSLAMNIAARQAKNDVLILTTTDGLLMGEFLEAVARHHSSRPHMIISPALQGEWFVVNRTECDGGASLLREDYHKIRGYDERMRGWGSFDTDFFNRLKRAGVPKGMDPTYFWNHLGQIYSWLGVKKNNAFYHPETGELIYPDVVKLGHENKNGFLDNENFRMGLTVVNDENWGTLDTLEEMRFG